MVGPLAGSCIRLDLQPCDEAYGWRIAAAAGRTISCKRLPPSGRLPAQSGPRRRYAVSGPTRRRRMGERVARAINTATPALPTVTKLLWRVGRIQSFSPASLTRLCGWTVYGAKSGPQALTITWRDPADEITPLRAVSPLFAGCCQLYAAAALPFQMITFRVDQHSNMVSCTCSN